MSQRRLLLAATLLLAPPTFAVAQFFGGGINQNNNVPPTEFVFARWEIRDAGGWWHDYPAAEQHINQIMSEATGLNVERMSYRIVQLDSDDVFKYPFGYISEPGMMRLSEEEVKNFREFVDRGGFVMLDDFDNARQFEIMRENIERVFPDKPLVHLKGDHNILRTYYSIDSLYVMSPYNVGAAAEFWGINDDDGTLRVIICFNNDVGDFWEYIDQPQYALKPSAEALRLGINFVLYALTH
jgi:hypothetical protein